MPGPTKTTKKGNRPSYDVKMKSIGREMNRRKLQDAKRRALEEDKKKHPFGSPIKKASMKK